MATMPTFAAGERRKWNVVLCSNRSSGIMDAETTITEKVDTSALAAALEVIGIYRNKDVIGHMHGLVKRTTGILKLIADAGLEKEIVVKSNTWANVSIFKGKDGELPVLYEPCSWRR